jgi:hypothetical protein
MVYMHKIKWIMGYTMCNHVSFIEGLGFWVQNKGACMVYMRKIMWKLGWNYKLHQM